MENVIVNATALRELLEALNGPDHLIREIQALRGNPKLFGANCIDVLLTEYNLAVESYNKETWFTEGNKG